jgi:hypothetical protein
MSADTANVVLATVTTLIATVFAFVTIDRWRRRHQPHVGAWMIAMSLFAVGAGAFWWAESDGWSMPVFRLFFLVGAVLNVAWLALGSLYLLVGGRAINRIRTFLVAASFFAAGVVISAPSRAAIPDNGLPRARDLFGPLPRVLVAVGSGVPALIIILGAGWSVWRVARRQNPALAGAHRATPLSAGRLVLSNLTVMLGTVILSASGSLAGRLGEDRAFAVTLTIGVVVLFAGFLVAGSRRDTNRAAIDLVGQRHTR